MPAIQAHERSCCNPSVLFPKSVNNLGVIPGKLAIASATRNPGKSKLLDTRFRGYDGGALAHSLCEL